MDWKSIVTMIATVLITGAAQAQDTSRPGPIAWGGGFGDDYKAVVLTEAGIHVTTAPGHARLITTVGMLGKTGSSDAVGLAMFLSGDEHLAYGFEARYRHWFGPHHFIDAGVGVPVYVENEGLAGIKSPYMMVKWSPVDWFGIALRPEYRSEEYPTHTVDTDGQWHYGMGERGKWYLSGGVEFNGKPGLVIQGVGAFLLYLAFSSMHGG
jgi:hypothetical protein